MVPKCIPKLEHPFIFIVPHSLINFWNWGHPTIHKGGREHTKYWKTQNTYKWQPLKTMRKLNAKKINTCVKWQKVDKKQLESVQKIHTWITICINFVPLFREIKINIRDVIVSWRITKGVTRFSRIFSIFVSGKKCGKILEDC